MTDRPQKGGARQPENRKGVKGPEHPQSVGRTRPRSIELVGPDDEPFRLEAGGAVAPVTVEYETYGQLNEAGDNVILIAHALSGDAHAAGWDEAAGEGNRKWRTRKPGWWDEQIGPGLPLDTARFYFICANVLGSCYGTTGPMDPDPLTGEPYGLRFPLVTISDWVRLQARLLDQLGIGKLYAVIGGSLGGQQALEWALAFPERVERCIILASSARLSPQGLAFNAVARHSILSDPNFCGGDYYGKSLPDKGLAAARMLGHITYLSDEAMYQKFGRRLQGKSAPEFSFGIEFEVESYLAYQGRSFAERFDANAYLYVTRAMDYYDAAHNWGDGDLTVACKRIQSKMLMVSFSTDWLYPPRECRELALAISRNRHPVTYVNIISNYGHDAFLVEHDQLGGLLRDFLESRPEGGA